jgi:hypothetical protein
MPWKKPWKTSLIKELGTKMIALQSLLSNWIIGLEFLTVDGKNDLMYLTDQLFN